MEKVEAEKCPDESPLPEAASELNISDSFSSDLENVEKVKRTEEPALTEANSEVKKSDIVSPDLKEVEEKKSPEEATLPEKPSSKELKKSDSVKTDLEKVEAEKSSEPVLPEKPSEIKEILPPAALKRPREEENISLDSAKKAKLDISEETLEQNINPNSISTKTDTTNKDDDKKNQNVVKTGFYCSICKTKHLRILKFDQIEELRLHLAQHHFFNLIFKKLKEQLLKNPICPMNNCKSLFNHLYLVSKNHL